MDSKSAPLLPHHRLAVRDFAPWTVRWWPWMKRWLTLLKSVRNLRLAIKLHTKESQSLPIRFRMIRHNRRSSRR